MGQEYKAGEPGQQTDYLQQVEAERDALRRRVEYLERKTARVENDLAVSQGYEEGHRVELQQSSDDLSEANETIDRQADSIGGHRDSIARLEGELDAAGKRADLLQRAAKGQALELREKEMLLAWVLETSVDGVLVYRSVVGDNGKVADFECVLNNPAAVRLYGLEELTGKRLLHLHPDLHEAGLWENYLRVLETGEPYEGEYCHRVDGAVRWFRVLAIKVADGLAVTFSNITIRKEMEEELKRLVQELNQTDQLKNDFLGVISHELRTPINGMMGFISIVKDELAGPLTDAQRDYLSKAERSTERLLGLVSNLLDMSRIQAGRFSVDTEPTEFAPIAEGALADLQAVTHEHTIRNEVPSDLPHVLADRERIAQVLRILLDNAAKFSSKPGTITIRACLEERFLRCEVVDTGIGIPKDKLHKVFAVFSQVDMSSVRERGGAGLGLILAKSLIEAHGGTIGVESQEGQGSVFWFTLPVVQ